VKAEQIISLMYLLDENKKPLFTLTVAEYKKILRKIVAEEIERILRELHEETDKNNKETDICDIEQAINITRLARPTLYSKVSKKHIPCLSRGKPLLFLKDHLEMWLKADRPQTDSITTIGEILKKKELEDDRNSELISRTIDL
jgi:hypothetical protein